MNQRKIEIMSPAGGMDSLIAAIQGGADAIYFGVEQLNMRARATMNFKLADIEEVANICRKNNIRSYLALNTIIYDHDLSVVKKIIHKAKEAGITAIIAADQAVISYAHNAKMEVHISTQVNITNVETIKFYAAFADTVVLARELSLIQIKNIVDAIKKEQIKGPSGKLIAIEIFVHGALCMAVSGKCHLSLHTHNASANRGACVQNCRRTYTVTDNEDGHTLEIENEYIMSTKDLCTIDFIDQVLDTGVSILKIEGRGKGPEYVKTVSRCYHEAVDAYLNGTYTKDKMQHWKQQLDTVFNRGFWSGYYLGQQLGEWTDTSGSKAKTKKVYLGKGSKYYSKIGVAEFKIENYQLQLGDKILIIGPTTGVIETVVNELHNDSGPTQIVTKGDICCFKLDTSIRPSDKLYKLVSETT